MIVEYASWEVGTADLDAYQRWMREVVAACRAEAGCLAYEFRVDPSDPRRSSLFQAWESSEAFAAHLVFPVHQTMLEVGDRWSTRDIRRLRWTHAEGFEDMDRPDR
jgi:quinol monooxygenase YgiN